MTRLPIFLKRRIRQREFLLVGVDDGQFDIVPVADEIRLQREDFTIGLHRFIVVIQFVEDVPARVPGIRVVGAKGHVLIVGLERGRQISDCRLRVPELIQEDVIPGIELKAILQHGDGAVRLACGKQRLRQLRAGVVLAGKLLEK